MRNYTIPIHMTQADVDSGKERDCHYCPIALALLRAIRPLQFIQSAKSVPKEEVHVNVGSDEALICCGLYTFGKAELPIKARQFITGFDSGRAMAPIAPFYLTFKPISAIPFGVTL